MTHRVNEHPKAGLWLSWHPASTERNDSTLCFIDILNANVEVQLLWVFRIRPPGRHPLRDSLKRQLTCARFETDDNPVAKVLVHLHAQHCCVELGECPRIRAVDDRLLQTSDHVADYPRFQFSHFEWARTTHIARVRNPIGAGYRRGFRDRGPVSGGHRRPRPAAGAGRIRNGFTARA
jgi:hypothetical protein